MDDMTEASEQEERQRRLARLRSLAGSQEQEANPDQASHSPAGATRAGVMPTTLPVLVRWRTPRRFWLRVGAAVLAVCVVMSAILVWVHQMHPAGQVARPIPDPLAIVLDPNFSCPREVAWSPDGSKVAVLGFRDCPSNNGSGSSIYQHGAIYVYDTRGGRVLARIQLDAPVTSVAAPRATANAQGQPNVVLDYSDLIWSPDGRRIAVQDGIMPQEQNTPFYEMTDLGTGLLLADPATGTVQVFAPLAALPAANYGVIGQLYSVLPPTRSPASSFQPVTALRWDLTNGTRSIIQVPQAAGYAWNANGMPQPASAIPASPDATPGPASQGAVGNADGGASFSMWQAGEVVYPQYCTDVPFYGGTSVDCCPVTAFYTATLGVTSAWSPDGRYLVQTPAGLLGATGKIAQTLAPAAVVPPNGCADPALAASLAQLPVRDAGMKGALGQLAPPLLTVSSPLPGPSGVNVAWSPDGQRLAVGYATVIGVGGSAGGVTVYDCASGKVLATINSGTVLAPLSSEERARDGEAEITALVWSPDSQRLLLFDPSHQILLIVGKKSLEGTGK